MDTFIGRFLLILAVSLILLALFCGIIALATFLAGLWGAWAGFATIFVCIVVPACLLMAADK